MIMQFPGARMRALTLSYDDGVRQDKRLVEIMVKNGVKGTFNLNSGMFDESGATRRMGKNEAISLYREAGMEVAVHGLHHRFLEKLHVGEMCYEVLKDRENLEAATGAPVRGMAYAYGTFNDAAVNVLRDCGIVYSRTCITHEGFHIPTDWLRLQATCHHNCPRLFELADKFLAPVPESVHSRRPRLFYLWGHSYEFDDNHNWDVIERLCERVGNRGDVWYATNIEVYDYVKAYESLVVGVGETAVYNPSALTVWCEKNGKSYAVKPGETVKLD